MRRAHIHFGPCREREAKPTIDARALPAGAMSRGGVVRGLLLFAALATVGVVLKDTRFGAALDAGWVDEQVVMRSAGGPVWRSACWGRYSARP
jgi:hypothetical protein